MHNEELRKAILGHNHVRAKQLLADGANINHAINENRDTILHEATTPYHVYCILGYGADVNASNIEGKTLLHTAAETGKCFGIIEELISHGADVNARDMYGNLPLNYAVRRVKKDYEVIKELVMRGSFVMQRSEAFDSNYLPGQTPLGEAALMNYNRCVKTLIKYHVLYRLPIGPEPNALVEYCRHRRYSCMRDYYNKCCFQLINMRTEEVQKQTGTTLLNLIGRIFRPILSYLVGREEKAMDSFANRCLWLVRSLKYSVYNDDILQKIEELIDHRCITNQIRELEIYTCIDQVSDVSPSADKKNEENDNNCNTVINIDKQKSLWHTDKKPSSSSVSKKWDMELYQTALNSDCQFNVDAHKNACMKFNSSQNDCAFTIGYQHLDQPQIDILDKELNLNDVYDIGAELTEEDYQPRKLLINENLNLDNVYDISAELNEDVDQPQNVILNKEVNLEDVNDIGADYNENVNQPQMDSLNEEFNRDCSRDIGECVEKGQNSKGTDNEEGKPSKKVVLNRDLVTTIAGYLGKKDLFNWFVAYYLPENIPEEDEAKGSMDRLRKQILKRVAEKPSSHPHKIVKLC